jgi:hypothetical protein
MGLRFRRSMGLAPGAWLNLGLRSLSLSFGIRGAKYTTGTRGRRITVGLPGTGLSYTKVISPSRRLGRDLLLYLLAILVVIGVGFALLAWLSSSSDSRTRGSRVLSPHLVRPAHAVPSYSGIGVTATRKSHKVDPARGGSNG